MDLDAVPAVCTLPPELLVHILSFVTDGRTLLDAVPLVCRRWHRLGVSRDSAAWRGARLCCTPGDVDAARVLLHAPALQSLLILYGETPWCVKQVSKLFLHNYNYSVRFCK
ncbi:hypothetical protein ONE63_005012 [Megalurothrips usitatus]|uniref:F-box domain-containing protein n=1 Tax=Megalurothrips usitatus TaxID=439358 RepID=A0AAV7X812_9NEOP|nr:hypothetical protein ONE63_005012 [Megalurothrips usitatus]